MLEGHSPHPLDLEGEGSARDARGEELRAASALLLRLEATEARHATVVEALRLAGEEVGATNAELQATNAELQTAKVELERANALLTNVNEQMRRQNRVIASVNADLVAVLGSVGLPIVLLDHSRRIRRFTPAAGALFGLVASDIAGRFDATGFPQLAGLIEDVLRDSSARRLEATAADGRWHQLSVRPYVGPDDRVDGVAVVVLDIDGIKAGQDALAAARDFAQSIVDTVWEWLLVLDEDRVVQSANRSLLRALDATPGDVIGRSIFELAGGAWDVPALRGLLEDGNIDEGGTRLNARVELDIPPKGRRVLAVRGQRIERAGRRTPSLLLALADVTEREQATLTLAVYQQKLARVAFETAVAEERERRRIAVDLHDSVGQALALIKIKLRAARHRHGGDADVEVDDCLDLVRQCIHDTRTLTFDLSPPILYDLGLAPALSWLADRMKQEHGFDVALADDGRPKPLPESVLGIVFRAVRELLMNALKHSRTSAARVVLAREGDRLAIDVHDEGVGFDAEPTGPSSGFGLFSLREQLTRLGGLMKIDSSPGRGAKIRMSIPVNTG